MASLITITCNCKTVTTFKWKPKIEFICPHCKKEIDYIEAIFTGRVKTNEYSTYKPKKKGR